MMVMILLYAGGISFGWKSDMMDVNVIQKHFQFMHVKISFKGGGEWFFTPVYASPNEDNRRVLWEELQNIALDMRERWVVGGDFNDIADINEKKRGRASFFPQM